MIVATFQDRELGGTALLGDRSRVGRRRLEDGRRLGLADALGASADSAGLSTLGRDGREVTISPEQAAAAGFVVLPVPRPGAFALPAGLRLRLERDGKPLSVLVPRPYSKSLWVQDASRPGGWRELALPAAVAADPLVWQDGVLVPGADARVYLIDPLTGRSVAEPFVPQFDRDHQGTWLAPAVLDPRHGHPGRRRGPGPPARAEDHARPAPGRPRPRRPSTAGSSPTRRPPGAAVLVATADGRVRSLAGET